MIIKVYFDSLPRHESKKEGQEGKRANFKFKKTYTVIYYMDKI